MIKKRAYLQIRVFSTFWNISVGDLRVLKSSLWAPCSGDQHRFVLAWRWAAQLADTVSSAVCCSWVLTHAEVCHCAPGALCHLQHLPWLLVGEASGTITVLWLSAPGVPVCFPTTCQCRPAARVSALISKNQTSFVLSFLPQPVLFKPDGAIEVSVFI